MARPDEGDGQEEGLVIRAGWSGRAWGLGLFIVVVLSLLPGRAYADPTPFISADLVGDFVDGGGFTPAATVTIEVFDSPGGTLLKSATTTARGDGSLFRDLDPFDLAPGQAVKVSESPTVYKELTLVPLAIAGVDLSADDVTGTADDGTTVNVNLSGPGPTNYGESPVSSGGTWTADFTGDFDIVSGTRIDASIADGDGDSTRTSLGPAQISADAQHENVDGSGFAPGASLTLEVFDLADVEVVNRNITANDEGGFFAGLNGPTPFDLTPGMDVQVTDGVFTKFLTLQSVGITGIDLTADDVTGLAANGTAVDVGAFGPAADTGGTVQTVAGAGDTWTADFTGTFDLVAGTAFNASIVDADGDSSRANRGPASVNADLAHDGIHLNNFEPSSSVTVTVSGPGSYGPAVVATDTQGQVFVDKSQHGLDLTPGLTIEVTQGSLTKTLLTANLSVTLVDPVADDITGTADPGTTVGVGLGEPGGTGAHLDVVANGSGDWLADFTGLHDITGTTGTNVGVNDPDGDSTGFAKIPAVISADLPGDNVNISSFIANSTVSLQISGGATFGPVSFPTDSFGNTNISRQQHGVDLVPGLTVTATQGGFSKTLELANLSVSIADVSTDDVTGTAPEGTPIDVNTCGLGACFSQQVTAAPGDTWIADFSGLHDILGDSQVNAGVTDPDGDATSYGKAAATIIGDVSCDCVNVNGFLANSTVSFEISGASAFGPASFPTDAMGNAFITRQQHDVDLIPGLTLAVSQGSFSKSLLLTSLTIATVDAASDDVTGSAPDGTTVRVNLFGPATSGSKEVTAQPGDTWTADFTGEFDITFTTGANARVFDADGDATSAGKGPASVDGHLTYDNINVMNFAANSSITLEISGGATFGPASFSTDPNGNVFIDRSQHNVDLVPGLTITLTQGSTSKVLVLSSLSVDGVDAAIDDVTGTALDGTTVHVDVGNETGGFGKNVVAVSGDTWTADFTGEFDITFTTGANARITDDDGDTTSASKDPATIDADLFCNCIGGNGFTPNAAFTVEITGDAGFGPEDFPTDGGGNFWLDDELDNIDLVPGLSVTVTQGSTSKVLLLADLSIIAVDPTTDEVTGTAPNGTTVRIDVNDGPSGFGLDVTASPGDTWTADFSGQFNITGTTNANAQITDADGDRTRYTKNPPTIDAELSCNCISGFGFMPDSSITLTVSDGASFGPEPFPTDGQGNFFVDGDQLGGLDIVPGLTIEVMQGSITKTLVVANLSITSVDPVTDDVTGAAPNGTAVHVDVGDETGGSGKDVTAGPGDTWAADFSGEFDITNTTFAGAHVQDADGDSTSDGRNPPTIDADLSCDCIGGSGFAPGSVTVTISGGAGYGPASVPTDGQGNFGVDRNLTGVDLVPGLTIEVTQGSITKTLVVANLSITLVDPAADDVTGTADEGTAIRVDVGDGSGFAEQEITASAGDVWTADFTGDFDITADTFSGAHIRDEDGDTTSYGAEVPRIEGDLTCDCVYGNGFLPSASVTLTISGGTSFGPSPVPTDGDGNFFIGSEETDVDLVPGLTITVTQGSLTKILVLANLSITGVDVGSDQVTGTADEGTTVQVDVFDETTGEAREVVAGPGDTWTAIFSPFDITPAMGAGAHISDADGDQTNYFAQPPRIDADLFGDGIWVEGFAPNANVTLTITGASSFGPEDFLTDDQGNTFIDPSAHGVDLVPGLSVTVTQGSLSKVLVLQSLSITFIDTDNDDVTGTAGDGTDMFVDVGDHSGSAGQEVTAGAGDTWTADFTGQFDITFRTFAGSHISDDDGDTTSYGKGVPAISGHLICDCIEGRNFSPDSTVMLTISGGASYGPASVPTDAGGNFGIDRALTGVDLVPGLTITVTQGPVSKTLVLENLSISYVDAGSETISGTADEGATVDVNVGSEEFGDGREVVAQAGNIWTADFSGSDIQRDMHAEAHITDGDGDSTSADKGVATVDGELSEDSVSVLNFLPNSTVTVDFTGAPDPSPNTFPTDDEGSAFIGPAEHGADLAPGLTVTVTQGVFTKSVTLQNLTVDVVNPETDVVSGTADAGTTLRVYVPFIVPIERCCPEIDVTADAGGNWSADFTGIDQEVPDVLEPASVGYGEITDAEGDATVVRRAATEESTGTITDPGGGEVNTDPENDGATPSDPLETSVTTSNDGDVTITETQTTGTAPSGYSFLDQQINITAPPGTVADPLVLVFRIDASLIPEGETAATIQVFRNGALVPACNNQTGNASPNPCVSSRRTLGDGDIEITVLTSDASSWNFGVGGGPPPAELALSSATYSVNEDGSVATITVVRSGGTQPVAVTYSTSDGSSAAGADYTTSTGALSFADGETSKTFDIPILEDDRFEGSETVQVALSSPTGGALLLSPSSAVLTILDNDSPPVLRFDSSSVSIPENAGTATLTITRTGATDNSVTVDYALGPGTATAGSDFTLVAGTVSLGEGEVAETIDVPITNDTTGESAETLLVKLSNPGGGALLGTPNQATVEIQTSDQQPDVLVGLKDNAKFLQGDDIYNTDGNGQAVSVDGRPGQTKTLFARVCNDGTQTNTLTVTGTTASGDSSIRYVKGNLEVTDSVISGGHSVTLGKGQCVTIKIVITVGASAATGTQVTATMTASWVGDGILRDVATASVVVS